MRMRCRRCDFRVAVTRRVVNYGLCRGGPEARVAMCRYRLQQQHLGKHYALHLRTRYSCDVALPIVTSSARLFYHFTFFFSFFSFFSTTPYSSPTQPSRKKCASAICLFRNFCQASIDNSITLQSKRKLGVGLLVVITDSNKTGGRNATRQREAISSNQDVETASLVLADLHIFFFLDHWCVRYMIELIPSGSLFHF